MLSKCNRETDERNNTTCGWTKLTTQPVGLGSEAVFHKEWLLEVLTKVQRRKTQHLDRRRHSVVSLHGPFVATG